MKILKEFLMSLLGDFVFKLAMKKLVYLLPLLIL
jgi:hypothetical protein